MQAIEGEEVLEVYSNEWIVGIPEGPKIADEIAEKLGFVNKGLVSILSLRSQTNPYGKGGLPSVSLTGLATPRHTVVR